MFVNNPDASIKGGLAVAVPGELRGIAKAHEQYGKVKWKDLFVDSINTARAGFKCSGSIANAIAKTAVEDMSDNLKEVYAPGGVKKVEGDKIRMPDLADTLEKIAESRDAGVNYFYSGNLGKEIVKAVSDGGGIMTEKDLTDYSAKSTPNIYIDYKGYQISSLPSPCGGPFVLSAMNVMEGFNINSTAKGTGEYYHKLVESIKFVTAMGSRLGDPLFDNNMQNITTDMLSGLLEIHFWAPWATQCEVMNTAMTELAKTNLQVNFAKVEAESVPEVSLKCEITAVPTSVLLKNKQVIDRVNGANGPELEKKVKHHADANASPAPAPKEDLNNKLKRLINTAPCMLFMKGNPDQPRCGFSRTTIELLNRNNIEYKTFDILEDNDVRQGLKTYSNWPTFPQLYLNGDLVGGLDILKEMDENGDMKEGFPVKEKLDDKLKRLINTAPCMLFMKGNPDQPRCGFSKTTIELLSRNNIEYKTFDILEDNDVRQGLKTYSNWPTFPQLYLNGDLVGGLDILKEMEENGDMKEGFPVKEKLDDKLKKLINTAPCMLFMKGHPGQPRCGFSKTTIELLNRNNIQYKTFDILEDNDVRQGLKTFSNWPTFPQLYLNGDLVGGLDILKEMEENGDLKEGFPKTQNS